MKKKVRTIFPMGEPHSVQRSLFTNPPKGYKFVRELKELEDKNPDRSKIANIRRKLSYNPFLRKVWNLSKYFHNPIMKQYDESKGFDNHEEIKRADILFSGRILPTNKPYWIEVEHVRQLMGWDIRLMNKHAKWIANELAKPNCRLITSYTKAGIEGVIDNLPNSERFKDKCHFVYNAVESAKFKKKHHEEDIVILFIGSKDLPYDFYMKGGHTAIEAFKLIAKKYPRAKLVVKPWAPEEVKKACSKFDNIKFEGITSWEEAEKLFKETDILVAPNNNTVAKAFLDAMNYEIPIITTDVWANRELVQEGYNGLIVPPSRFVPQTIQNNIPNSRTPEYDKAVKLIDNELVKNVADKLELLIRDKKLRVRLGKNGKKEVESGKFSIKKRNEKYKRLLDRYF